MDIDIDNDHANTPIVSDHIETDPGAEAAVAKTDEAAYAAVEQELRRNPEATQDELWEKAKEASPGVARLSRREFNARYPLQIKRKIQRESGGGGRKRAAGAKRAGSKRTGTKRAGAKAAGAKRAGAKKRGARKGRGAAVAVAAAGTPARRRPGRPKGSGRKAAAVVAVGAAGAAASMDRDSIRQAFLGFATDVVSAADQPKNLIKVLANVDKYVDRVVKSRR
jgi:hypothetical protein